MTSIMRRFSCVVPSLTRQSDRDFESVHRISDIFHSEEVHQRSFDHGFDIKAMDHFVQFGGEYATGDSLAFDERSVDDVGFVGRVGEAYNEFDLRREVSIIGE